MPCDRKIREGSTDNEVAQSQAHNSTNKVNVEIFATKNVGEYSTGKRNNRIETVNNEFNLIGILQRIDLWTVLGLSIGIVLNVTYWATNSLLKYKRQLIRSDFILQDVYSSN